MFYNRQTPWETNFQVRATPFPISPSLYDFVEGNFILGTSVTIDNIYNNLGDNDKYGYNTEVSYPQNYYIHPPIAPGETNVQGKTVTTPAWRDPYDNFLNLTAEFGNKLILKPDMKFWISGIELYGGDKIQFKSGSTLRLEANSEIRTCREGQLIIDGGTILELNNLSNQYCHDRSKITYNGGSHTINNNSAVTIKNGGTLELTAGTQLVFDGSGSKLKLESGSNVKLGTNAKIIFTNGAHIEADGSTFSGLNGDLWHTVSLENAGSQSFIKNCTFNNASTAITIINSSGNESLNKVIQSNTFNIPVGVVPGGAKGIYANNVFQLLIENNIFNLGGNSGNYGISIYNTSSGSGNSEGSGPVSSYSLNILGNLFNGGGHHMVLNCMASNLTPFLVKSNKFNASAYSEYSAIFTNKITGDIKYNEFQNLNNSTAVTLQQSTVNIYSNIFKAVFGVMELQSLSTVQMSAVQNGSQWLWYGGYNTFTTDVGSNINFSSGSNPVTTPLGKNCFYSPNSPYHQITGILCGSRSPVYDCYSNYWSTNPPVFSITCGGNPITVNYSSALSFCPTREFDNIILVNAGNDVQDTLYLSDAGDGDGGGHSSKLTSVTDNTIYIDALAMKRTGDFAGAINKCKELLNNYDSSLYTMQAVSELYLNYLESDTSGNQTITTGLFNELKSYLEQKMQQYALDAQVTEKLYKHVLMCLGKTRDYTEAIAGYENIMNNHPDEITRLNASWDRSATILLMNGAGGNQENSLEIKYNKLFDRGPSHKIAKETFKRAKKDASETVIYTKQEKAEFERRIERFNPVNSEELITKISSDMRMVEQVSANKSGKQTISNIPQKYMLYQNYPNPFNPETNIKFDIPKDGFVTLKIYDILGKEVYSLNEFKLSGTHEIKFDGTGFASGMYFYTLEANGYKETKKMVLIK